MELQKLLTNFKKEKILISKLYCVNFFLFSI